MEYNEKNNKSMHIILKIKKKYQQKLHLLIIKTKNSNLKNNKFDHNILHKKTQRKILKNNIIVLVHISTNNNGNYSERIIINIKKKEENNK